MRFFCFKRLTVKLLKIIKKMNREAREVTLGYDLCLIMELCKFHMYNIYTLLYIGVTKKPPCWRNLQCSLFVLLFEIRMDSSVPNLSVEVRKSW